MALPMTVTSAGRPGAGPLQMHSQLARVISVRQLHVYSREVLPVLQHDWFCGAYFADTGIKRARKRRIRIALIRAIEYQNVLARTDVIEIEYTLRALKTPKARAGVVIMPDAI